MKEQIAVVKVINGQHRGWEQIAEEVVQWLLVDAQ